MNLQPTRLLSCLTAGLVIVLAAAFAAPSSTLAATPTSTAFLQNHELWDSGPDVLSLQQWLNANGYPLAESGTGSPGQETDTFGPLTYDALLKFQGGQRPSRVRLLRAVDTCQDRNPLRRLD